uniref:Ig-like domain-containing protein n=1 Tax=Denticeps clupeoides TaxID=299321 RepID=A0AAY4DB50_9TELE
MVNFFYFLFSVGSYVAIFAAPRLSSPAPFLLLYIKHFCPLLIKGQRSVSSRLGGSVTLTCFSNEDSLALWIWHKQTPGQPMKPVVSAFSNRATFEDGVDKDHYEVESSKKSFNLTIKDIVAADEGLYYCGMSSLTHSPTVQVKQHYLLDPASEGDDVTLNCTVISGGCAGEHSVYWFRHGTPGSHPGIIYTHGDRSAGCEKNPEAGSSTQSCVYHLPKRNLSTTDAGTYYCAVAACGQIMIGIGTKLDVVGMKFNSLNPLLAVSPDNARTRDSTETHSNVCFTVLNPWTVFLRSLLN